MSLRIFSLLGLAALALIAAACAGSAATTGESREVQVDWVHDEVASSFIAYFPQNITMRAGDTIQFRQHWTGEPHSVTMGTLVDEMMGVVGGLMEEYAGVPDEEIPPEAFEQFFAAMESLPPMISEDVADRSALANQNAAQPCYLDEGLPPEDPSMPCAEEDQVQPAFNGRQSYYNSGFIPYEGPQGNEFTVELAADIEPGVYSYYCNLHGPFQSGTITIVGDDEPIPSAADVARQTQEEIEAVARPLVEAFEAAKAGETELEGQTYEPPIAGWWAEDGPEDIHAIVNEFIPETINARVGVPVTWIFAGPHTVSFQVPSYFTIATVDDDGTVTVNPDAFFAVNSPGHPEMEAPPPGEEAPEGEGAQAEGQDGDAEGPPDGEGGPPPPPEIDAGEWDGAEFISSGMFWDGTYTLTFTTPGTYPYACLIHPQMVGAVVVE